MSGWYQPMSFNLNLKIIWSKANYIIAKALLSWENNSQCTYQRCCSGVLLLSKHSKEFQLRATEATFFFSFLIGIFGKDKKLLSKKRKQKCFCGARSSVPLVPRFPGGAAVPGRSCSPTAEPPVPLQFSVGTVVEFCFGLVGWNNNQWGFKFIVWYL